MAELADKRREQFCKLRAAGMKQAEAYAKAGYRTGDRSNASKLEQQPEISERIFELRAEELQRQQQARLQAAELPGIDELKRALQGAAAAGQWSAVVSAAKALAEGDGSLDPDPAEADAFEERRRILRELFELFPESAHPDLERYLAQPADRPGAVRAASRP